MKIETSDIYRSIKTLLEDNFTDVTVQIKDIKNPVPPCFYIMCISETVVQSAVDYETNNCSFDVIYFSEDETLLDLLTVEETLKTIFKKPLKIELTEDEETIIQWQEIDSISISRDEDEYITHCMLDITLDQMAEDDNRYNEYENDEYMNELEI